MAASLLVALPLAWGGRAGAAELLELRLDGLAIPIRLDQLEAWSRGAREPAADLEVWLGLLEAGSREDLRALLKAPLLRDQSFGRQVLDSWAGSQMLATLGELLTSADGSSTTALLPVTLRELLARRQEVTAIELLRALPPRQLVLDLDGLLSLADGWRGQLQRQGEALRSLRRLSLPEGSPAALSLPAGPGPLVAGPPTADEAKPPPIAIAPRLSFLTVSHRREPLPLEIWLPSPAAPAASRPWLLLMPGLGGTTDQLGWLAADLAARGWAVVAMEHPGSDAQAVRAALEGQRPPPGAETLAIRLDDVEAVLEARRSGGLEVPGDGVVLVGHSLGGLTALLAAGMVPEPGLDARCQRALRRLPIANPSRLLQCQLPAGSLPAPRRRPPELKGVVAYNAFGSLLWPHQGLRPLPLPVLLVGGGLDLVTPPIDEQLSLFLPAGHRRSRLVLVDGGSHFSPVRVSGQEEVLFRLGSDLVGEDPAVVQGLLLALTGDFLASLETPPPLAPQVRRRQGVSAWLLDPSTARRWERAIHAGVD
ncbi:alpha/beta hydrolase [Cyanobium sp. FGCU-52]|nr:alpha/beta hydrolase [Cyanobium sp. FGCU52]